MMQAEVDIYDGSFPKYKQTQQGREGNESA